MIDLPIVNRNGKAGCLNRNMVGFISISFWLLILIFGFFIHPVSAESARDIGWQNPCLTSSRGDFVLPEFILPFSESFSQSSDNSEIYKKSADLSGCSGLTINGVIGAGIITCSPVSAGGVSGSFSALSEESKKLWKM